MQLDYHNKDQQFYTNEINEAKSRFDAQRKDFALEIQNLKDQLKESKESLDDRIKATIAKKTKELEEEYD